MSKVWTFVTITVGLTLLMKLAGIPTGLDWMLSFLGLTDGATANNSTFFLAIATLLSISTGVSIVIGIFGRAAPEYAILAPFAVANLLVFASTFVSIISYTSSFENWIRYPIFLIFGVLTVGFVLAVIEWTFGRN